MTEYVFTVVACGLAIFGYLIYYLNIKQSGIIPNRLAWVICCVSVSLETITYCFISGNPLISIYFVCAAICSILITIKVWKLAKWDGASRLQKNSLVFYSLAIAVWPLFNLPFIAHLLLLIVIPITFFPIYLSAYKQYKEENSLPWLLWSVSDLLIIINIAYDMKTPRELPYAIVQFICPFTVFAIIIFQRLRYSKKIFRFYY